MYTAVARANSLNDKVLFSSPGVEAFATNGTLPSRGAIAMGGVYYTVNDTVLYSVDEDGVVAAHGTITGSARVSMAHNGKKLCIVSPGGDAYQYEAATTTLTQITDVDFVTADTVVWKDGYYIFSATAGDKFFISALNDPLTYDALDFGAAELFPDDIIAVHANYDEVFVLGENTTEVFQNIGGSGFPFQRIPGASFEKGAHSKYSPIQWEGNFYFLGGGANERTSVFKAGGSTGPVNISTDAIDHQIQLFSRTEIGSSYSFAYSIDGFSFVGFTFVSVNISARTFVYSITASELLGRPVWLEHQTGLTANAWRVASVDFVYDKLLVSDRVDGRIGTLSTSVYTEYGSAIIREKVTGPLKSNGESLFVHSMELTDDSGQGLISGQGSDPVVMMDFSDDGARTWSNEFWRNSGKMGEYGRRMEWRRLGRVPAHRVWRFRATDPVKTTWIKLEAEISNGY